MKNQTFLERTFVVCLFAMLCCFLWGSAFPCIKIGYRMFQINSDQTMSQILFAGVRFTLAGVLVILFGSIINRKILVPKKSSCKNIMIICLFQTVIQYLFFYIGMAHTSGVKASIVEASNVFLAILVANVIFHQEKLTLSKIAGCIIGFAGVILINLTGSGLDAGMSLTGEGFILISAAAYAVSSVLIKRFSAEENPVVISGYQFMVGGLIMILIGVAGGGNLKPTSALSGLMMLYMALISAVAYTVWGILLKYNPVSKVAVFGFMNPVFGVVLSALLLNESSQIPFFQCAASLILVCLGIYVVNKNN
ncbi:MAG: DMT family transporter [Suilimivivens sp.]